MTRLLFIAVVTVAVVLTFVWCDTHVTPLEQCDGQQFEDLHERIQVKPCGKSRCKLRQGTNITVNFRFKPKHEVKTLVNNVNSNIGGLVFPFVGVDGQSACAHIKRADDGQPAPCPLAADQEYTYTKVFPVEPFYPTISIRVHWALNDGKRDLICFEVPAVITTAKSNKN